MSLGPAEILVILVVALIVFGPKRLPEVGRQVGNAMRELRKMQHSVRSEIDSALNLDGMLTDGSSPSPKVVSNTVEDVDHSGPELAVPESPPPDDTNDPGDGFANPRSFS